MIPNSCLKVLIWVIPQSEGFTLHIKWGEIEIMIPNAHFPIFNLVKTSPPTTPIWAFINVSDIQHTWLV